MEQHLNVAELQLTERQHARAGRFQYYSLVHGRDHSLGNFYLQLSRTYSDFYSPRHRHNFEQVRFQIEGTVSFGRDGVMSPGTIGYFPEGVYYGPQTLEGESYTLVLQFGGPSLSGYMSETTFQAAMEQMKAHGTFGNGIYTEPKPGGGKKNRDAYEAVWEYVNGRKLRYPKARYDKPVFIETTAFDWTATPNPGTEQKHLGTFSEYQTAIDVFRLQADSALTVGPNTVVFVIGGTGQANGKPWERHSALYSGNETSRLVATQTAELLVITLPALPETVSTNNELNQETSDVSA